MHPIFEQAERIAGSPLLQQADSLVRLLRYLARHAVESPGTSLKEAQIARDVFARGDGFDPRSDSTVRVQCSRLRGRLADYYRTHGAGDETLLELPRGQYHLSIREAGEPAMGLVEAEAAPVEVAAPVPVLAPVPVPEAPRLWPARLVCALGGLAAGALLMLALFPSAATTKGSALPPSVAGLWAPLLDAPQAPLVVVPLDGASGAHAVAEPYVQAAHELTRLFARAGQPPRLQVVGAAVRPAEGAVLLGIPPAPGLQPSLGFAVRELPAGGARAGLAAIVNLDPAPGETAEFVAGGVQYALVARLTRRSGGAPLVLVAGVTPEATQAAAVQLTREDFAALLPRGEDDSWAAVVRVALPGTTTPAGVSPVVVLRRVNP